MSTPSLFGGYVKDEDDYAEEIVEKLSNAQDIAFYPDDSEGSNLVLVPNVNLNRHGFYCIYKNGIPLFVGYSSGYVRNRIHRFVKTALGTNRHDEDHSGAQEFTRFFSDRNDMFNDTSVRYFEFYAGQDITASMKKISSQVSKKMNTVLNKENKHKDINHGFHTRIG
jgi:hypothetical protein